jgi:hypothetical protein
MANKRCKVGNPLPEPLPPLLHKKTMIFHVLCHISIKKNNKKIKKVMNKTGASFQSKKFSVERV